jgi:hypothetical protein
MMLLSERLPSGGGCDSENTLQLKNDWLASRRVFASGALMK